MVNNNECKIYRYARHLPSVLNKSNNIYRNALTAVLINSARVEAWIFVTWQAVSTLVTCHLDYLPLGHVPIGLLATCHLTYLSLGLLVTWLNFHTVYTLVTVSKSAPCLVNFYIINNVYAYAQCILLSQSFDFPCLLVPFWQIKQTLRNNPYTVQCN